MKALTRFADLVLYTSVFTALCALGLCMATERLILAHSPSLFSSLHVLVLGSSLLVYNTPRIIRRSNTGDPAKQPFRPWYFFLFFAGLAMAVAGLYRQPAQLQLSSVVLSLFAFAYFLPLLPFKNKRRKNRDRKILIRNFTNEANRKV